MKRLSPDIVFESNHLSSDLARKSVRSGMVTMTTQVFQFVLNTAGTVVLARLLTPSDYGLIGMVSVVVGFAVLFKDAGLSMATVQKDRITHEQISTLFWINILISVFLSACVLAASPLVSRFYGRPELTAVSAAMSISFIISGLMIQHQALLRRHMQFGTLAIIRIATQVISLGLTIGLALSGWRYWALVYGPIAACLVGTLMTLFFCPWLPGRMKKGAGARDMLKFGAHLTGFNFINYFSRNLDNILIGKFIGADALGLYAKAYNLFMMPISQIRGPMTKVAMPVLSTLKDQPERYIQYYQRFLNILASLTIPLTLYCFIEADFLIRSFLGPQWLRAVPVFRILALAAVLQPITGAAGMVQLSLGYSRRYLNWGFIGAFIFITSFVIGLPFGIEGVATAYAIANGIIFFPTLFYCFNKSPVTVTLVMKTVAVPILITTIAVVGATLTRFAIAQDTVIAHLSILAVFALIIIGANAFRKSTQDTLRLFLNNMGTTIYKRPAVAPQNPPCQ